MQSLSCMQRGEICYYGYPYLLEIVKDVPKRPHSVGSIIIFSLLMAQKTSKYVYNSEKYTEKFRMYDIYAICSMNLVSIKFLLYPNV